MRSIGLKTLMGAAALAAMMATPAAAEGLSGSAAVTSNYLFRGISQTDDMPAVQAGINYDFGNGLSVGVWASSLNFSAFGDPKSRLETDYTATYTRSFGAVDVSVGGIFYAYHTSQSSLKYNFFEGWGGLSHDFGPFSAYVNVYYSPEFFGVTKSGWYINPGVGIPINDWLSASASYGYQSVDSPGYFSAGQDSYSNWNFGLTGTYHAYSLGVMYSQNDIPGKIGDAKFVVTLGASF